MLHDFAVFRKLPVRSQMSFASCFFDANRNRSLSHIVALTQCSQSCKLAGVDVGMSKQSGSDQFANVLNLIVDLTFRKTQ